MLIQEELPAGDRLYPWMTLVANILLRRTKGDQVRKVLYEVLGRWPTPEDLADAGEDELRGVIGGTGLGERKAAALRRMSEMYLLREPKTYQDLPGSWKYARESWRIFVDGDLNFSPTDKSLLSYVRKFGHPKVGTSKNRPSDAELLLGLGPV